MRSQDHVVELAQRRVERLAVGRRLFREDVDRRTGQMFAGQYIAQRRDIHHGAARGVDQNRTRLHQRQLFCTHHVLGRRGFRHVQRHHVAHIEQIGQVSYLLGITQRQLVLDVVEKHLHAQAFGQDTQLGADMAVADNPQSLAARFERADGQFLPLATVCLGVGGRNAAQHQQQLAQHHFGYGSGIGERRVKHRNAAFGRRFQINLVSADTETTHRHQFFCGSENFFGQMRTRSDADEVSIADGCLKRFGV
ncbi:hypothetical protein D3C81_225200 [compost metagenome]